jgi:hypothetical protein
MMVDVVILDQLALQDFMSALESLNVKLMYDHRNTGYFERSEWSHKVSIKCRRMVVSSKRFSNWDGWEDYLLEERVSKFMPPMAELPQPKTKVVVPPNRADALNSTDYHLHHPIDQYGYEFDFDEYMLDFWEGEQEPAIRVIEPTFEESGVIGVDEDGI